MSDKVKCAECGGMVPETETEAYSTNLWGKEAFCLDCLEAIDPECEKPLRQILRELEASFADDPRVP